MRALPEQGGQLNKTDIERSGFSAVKAEVRIFVILIWNETCEKDIRQ